MKLFAVIIFLLFCFTVGRRVTRWFYSHWDAKSQVSIALLSHEGDVFILVLTPAKNMAVAIKLPANLIVETPWFGEYQAGKLSLLAKQEKNDNVFLRSLTYFLGIGIDRAILGKRVTLSGRGTSDKNFFLDFFLPFYSVEDWRIWRYLKKRDLIWKMVDLSDLSEKTLLADGTEVMKVDPAAITINLGGFLTDPVIKNENLSVVILNTGDKEGLAKKISSVVETLGVRVIKLETGEGGGDNCSLLVSEKKWLKTATVNRLVSVLGCEKSLSERKDLGGDIQILIKNVKIH